MAAFAATPTSAIGGIPSIVVRIPDPGSLAALDSLVSRIESDPAIWFVDKAIFPDRDELPVAYPEASLPFSGATSVLDRLAPQLAVRASAAWSARSALLRFGTYQPQVVIFDYFGDGVPNSDLNAIVNPADYHQNLFSGNLHGYHVAGIIAGTFGGVGDRGLVTGLMPGAVRLRAFDLESSSTSWFDPLTILNQMLKKTDDVSRSANDGFPLLSGTPGNIILNTSLGLSKYCDDPVVPPICINPIRAKQRAVNWVRKVRAIGFGNSGSSLEDRILHLTSAGNSGQYSSVTSPIMNALTNSFFATAALATDLEDDLGNHIDPLTNTLVIENDRSTYPAGTVAFAVRCLDRTSFMGGHLGAIGTNVWSFTDSTSTAGLAQGTSMAAPQVAGLAAYLLGLQPNLTVQQTKSILLKTARPVPVSSDPHCADPSVTPAPIIDAYAAVLAVDSPAALTTNDPSLAPIRRAILDLNNDGHFNETDLTEWVNTLVRPTAFSDLPDYSRHDLNGDGYTGGPKNAAFDLNITLNPVSVTLSSPPSRYSQVTKTIGGQSVAFMESSLTDLQILCYYVYSPLYEGDLATLSDSDRAALETKCQGNGPKILFSGSILNADPSGIFTIDPDGSHLARLTSISGSYKGWGWSPDGTTVLAVSEYSGQGIWLINADGSRQVRLTDNSSDGEPSFSPNGTRILLTRQGTISTGTDPSDRDIFVMNADGSNPINLTNNYPYTDVLPKWSPDGSKIAFVSDRSNRGNNWDLWVMNADGSGLRQVTTSIRVAMFNWSPEGTRIAIGGYPYDLGFTSSAIYVVDANASVVSLLSPLVMAHTSSSAQLNPVWSPDGSLIAYLNENGLGLLGVNIVNTLGSVLAISSVPAGSEPSWSSDSSRLVFTIPPSVFASAPSYDLAVIRTDGTLATRISLGFSLVSSPKWRP